MTDQINSKESKAYFGCSSSGNYRKKLRVHGSRRNEILRNLFNLKILRKYGFMKFYLFQRVKANSLLLDEAFDDQMSL